MSESNPIYTVTLCTQEYRGDHSADVRLAIRPEPDETIEHLISRCNLQSTDVLEIRVMHELPKR